MVEVEEKKEKVIERLPELITSITVMDNQRNKV